MISGKVACQSMVLHHRANTSKSANGCAMLRFRQMRTDGAVSPVPEAEEDDDEEGEVEEKEEVDDHVRQLLPPLPVLRVAPPPVRAPTWGRPPHHRPPAGRDRCIGVDFLTLDCDVKTCYFLRQMMEVYVGANCCK